MVSERQDQAMEDGINMDGISMEVTEENWRKTDKLLQQFIASTRKAFQDAAKRAESDRQFYNNLNEIRVHLGMPPIDYLCDSIGGGRTTIINHDEVTEAGLGLEKSARVEGQDLQVSVTGGSDQGRIPNPRTGSAGADDPTIFWGINIDPERPTLFKDFRTEWDVGASSQKPLVESKEHQEVISIPLDVSVAVESDRMDELALVKWADRGVISVEFLGNSIAHDLFVEMPKKGFLMLASVEA